MKKLYLAAALVWGLTAVACSEKHGGEGETEKLESLTVTLASPEMTRIEIGEEIGGKAEVSWQEGDYIHIVAAGGAWEYQVFSYLLSEMDNDGRTAKFLPVGTGGAAPVNYDCVYTGGGIGGFFDISISSLQTYVPGSIDDEAVIFGAPYSEGDIVLQGITPMVCLRLTGNTTLQSIRMDEVDGKSLVGKFLYPDFTPEANDAGHVLLSCKGVALSDEPTDFYFGCMPGEFRLKFTITAEDGTVMVKEVSAPIDMKGGSVYRFPVLEFVPGN